MNMAMIFLLSMRIHHDFHLGENIEIISKPFLKSRGYLFHFAFRHIVPPQING